MNNLLETSEKLSCYLTINALYKNESDFGFNYQDKVQLKDVQRVLSNNIDLAKASVDVMHFPFETPPVNAINMDYINDSTLPNNLRLVVDHTPGTQNCHFDFEMMFSQKTLSKYPGMDDFLNFIGINRPSLHLSRGNLLTEATFLPTDTLKEISSLSTKINEIPVSEEEFNNDKKDYLSIKSFNSKPLNRKYDFNPFLVNNARKERQAKEGIEHLTYNDFKNHYLDIIHNSSGLLVLTLPEEEYTQHYTQLKNTLISSMPKFAPQDIKKNLRTIQPLPSPIIETHELDNHQVIINEKILLPPIKAPFDVAGVKTASTILANRFENKLLNQGIYGVDVLLDLEMLNQIEMQANTHAQGVLKPQDIMTLYKEELEKMQTEPITQKELEKAQKNIIDKAFLRTERSTHRAAVLTTDIKNYDDIGFTNKCLGEVSTLKPEDINTIAKSYFSLPAFINVYGPKDVIDDFKRSLPNEQNIKNWEGMISYEDNGNLIPGLEGKLLKKEYEITPPNKTT